MAEKIRQRGCGRWIALIWDRHWTGIEGLSNEFYHYHEYRMPFIRLAGQLKQHYYDQRIYCNRYVDISLCPQTIEINLMG
jgi:hypothetical protein